MAHEVPGFMDGTSRAGADLTLQQHRFGVLDATGRYIVNAVAGGRADGVIQNNPRLDEATDVMLDGLSKIIVGAGMTIAPGGLVSSDAAGAARVPVMADHILGRAKVGGGPGTTITIALGYRGVA